MKGVVLCGGLGTRLAEETELKPKPMIEIGGRPIVWHILKHFACFGITESVLALGYKGEAIKRYFLEYFHSSSNLTLRLQKNELQVEDQEREDWTVHLVDTGQSTQTGGRIKRLAGRLDKSTFLLTYGDGVSSHAPVEVFIRPSPFLDAFAVGNVKSA